MTSLWQHAWRLAAGSTLIAACASVAVAQVQHGTLTVVENDGGNDPTSVTVTRDPGGFGAWAPVSIDGVADTSRADYVVDFGTGDDTNLGVLMVGPYEDERTEPSVNDGLSPYVATVSTARNTSAGLYWIAIHRASQGSEANYNPALAYFPIADGWLAGAAYNSANGGVITEFVGSPEITLTNPFDPNLPSIPSPFIDQFDGAGNFGLVLDGIDMRRDGVLLACGAKNEDNYTAVFINEDGNALLNNRDNGDNGGGAEQDPTSFVFVPDGTPGVTMGRITGTGNTIYGQGDFTVEMVGQPETNGTWRLTIAGESPATGTLIVTPFTQLGGNTVDNPVFAFPDGDGWVITSRDIGGMGLQDISSFDVSFHFAFFKDGVEILPVDPPQAWKDELATVSSMRVEVTEFRPDNGNGDMKAEKALGSDNLGIGGDNRGDIGMTWLNARPKSRLNNGLDAADGVWLGHGTEFFRDNSATVGVSGAATVSFDNGEARLHAAQSTGGEFNGDFSMAFFPIGAGFQQDADVQISAPNTSDTVEVEGGTGDAVTDGVLIATNWDNNNRFPMVTPSGSSYIIEMFEGTTGGPPVQEVDGVLVPADWDHGYVYLPFDTPGMIGGHIAADGSKIASVGDFTVSNTTEPAFGDPAFAIEIPGVDARTEGVLVMTALNPDPENPVEPTVMLWEPGANGEFIVGGLEPASGFVARVAFSFAYIPYEWTPAPAGLIGDLNCDGVVDFFDIDPFVTALVSPNDYPALFPDCDINNADVNEDGEIDFFDIDPFVGLIVD